MKLPSPFYFFKFYFKDFIYLLLERGQGREKERKRSIGVWLPLTGPLLGSWPATQACALIGNQSGNISVCRPVLSPLAHTSQGWLHLFKCKLSDRQNFMKKYSYPEKRGYPPQRTADVHHRSLSHWGAWQAFPASVSFGLERFKYLCSGHCRPLTTQVALSTVSCREPGSKRLKNRGNPLWNVWQRGRSNH